VWFLILINGSSNGFFGRSCDLCQGDCLSPLLFVFMMEVLSRMISAMSNDGLIEGFKVGNVSVSHLLFANDTLILCKACPAQLGYLRTILMLFKAASGLKVNLAKSALIPIGNVQQVGRLARILRCGVSTLPVLYLGLPKALHIWDRAIEKTECHLTGWKLVYLSKGSQVTLIKSTLANIPTFYLSLFPIPVKVANHIEKIQCDFLWGGLGDEFKYHLVNWSKVHSPISVGGLGIRKMLDFN
jgi:hypothetical protein